MNNYKNGYLYKVGEKISGIYHGVKYSGIVSNSRQHTMRIGQTDITVSLTEKIVVYGIERERIIVSILDDGKEI